MGIIGSAVEARAGDKAAKAQAQANQWSTLINMLSQQQATSAALGEMEPWTGMETKARVSMGDILGYNGPEAQQAAIDAIYKSPAYTARMQSGTSAIDRSAAARGGLFSGRTGMELAKYGSDLASQEYDKEYNRRASLMDWAYGNTKNRANIRAGGLATQGSLLSKYLSDQGQLEADTLRWRGNLAQRTQQQQEDNAWKAVGTVTSMYGGGGMFGKGGAFDKSGDDGNLYSYGVRQRRW